MPPWVDTFNICEGILWIVVAIVLFTYAIFLGKPKRLLAIIAAISFVSFGLTDFVETTTESWPPPWWLMIWKGVSGAGFVLPYVWYLKIENRLPDFLKKMMEPNSRKKR